LPDLFCLVCLLVLPPPPPAGDPVQKCMLMGYSDKYLANMDSAWKGLCVWCVQSGYAQLCPEALNLYIAVVCSAKGSAFGAKAVQAACNLLCDLMGVQKVHTSQTFRMVQSIERVTKKAVQVGAIEVQQVQSVFGVPVSWEQAVLQVCLAGGLRPFELDFLGFESFDVGEGLLWLRCAKGMSVRSVPLPPVLLDAYHWCKSHRGVCFRVSKLALDGVLFVLRCALAKTRHGLPQVSLRDCRVFCATHLYMLGACSAYVQRVLGHKYWSTSVGYIRLAGGVVPRWRSRSRVDVQCKWVSPLVGKLSFENPERYKKWVLGWRSRMQRGDLDEEEEEQGEDEAGLSEVLDV